MILSVVIPTHNREASLVRTLTALAAQSCPAGTFEVVVTADGCTDGTRRVGERAWPFPIRVVEQPASGPATARNRGAAAAVAPILLFLDDDVEARPSLVAAHVAAHAVPATVAIGYLPPDVQGRTDLFALMLRAWWEGMFERMRDPGHRFTYADVLTGNVSMPRALFEEAGRFDVSLRCHEDYELGYRLLRAGARFTFLPDAAGVHHERTDLRRSLARKRDEGVADVALARRHPELVAALPLSAARGGRRRRALRRLALTRPRLGDALEPAMRAGLAALAVARRRTRWRHHLDDLLTYWYWRGVGDALGGGPVPAVERRLDAAAPLEIDLSEGPEAAMAAIDAAKPSSLRLLWAGVEVGTVPPEPWAEPLAGRHLPTLLARRFGNRMIAAMRQASS